MNYYIWYTPTKGTYNHGTEVDYNVQCSLLGEELTVLYEFESSEAFLIKKIVGQLNAARKEQSYSSLIMK